MQRSTATSKRSGVRVSRRGWGERVGPPLTAADSPCFPLQPWGGKILQYLGKISRYLHEIAISSKNCQPIILTPLKSESNSDIIPAQHIEFTTEIEISKDMISSQDNAVILAMEGR